MIAELAGKVALVTGASMGWGYGIAATLKEAGCDVWAVARSEEKLKELSQSTGVRYLVADVTVAAHWDRVIDTILAESGRLDILVNNAGGGVAITPVTDQTDEDIETSISLNLTSAILGSKRAARIMQEQKSGTIIHVSSICAEQNWPGWGIYAAAKAGLNQFSRSLYVEMRPYNVRVTCLVPSWGNTAFQANANIPLPDPDVASQMINPLNMGQLITDICKLPAHLVIPEVTLLPLVQEICPY